MANITAAAVNELRQATGCGLMDCKKALVATEGNFEEAVTYLREKGLASQAKKATRVAAEGMAYATVVDGVGVIVEVNCESDFVGSSPLFTSFVEGVATVIAKSNPANVEALMACPWIEEGKTVDDAKNEVFLSLRENMQIRRFERVEGCVAVPYVHMKGKVAVLVKLDTEADADAVTTLGKDVAMQICALNPQYLDQANVPEDFIAKEKEIRLVTAKQDPKNAKTPEQVLAKIVEGQIGKMYKEICLLQMPFVKDDKLSVSQYVESVAKELGKAVKVTGFVRFEKGEGIEKRQDDLAAEVSKLVNG